MYWGLKIDIYLRFNGFGFTNEFLTLFELRSSYHIFFGYSLIHSL